MIKNFKYVEKENKIKRKRFMIFRVKKTTHSNHMNVLYIDEVERQIWKLLAVSVKDRTNIHD